MKKLVILCVVGVVSTLFASDLDSKKDSKNTESSTPKIELRGDSIVILDASCDSETKNNVISKLKNSKNTNVSMAQDCEIKK